MTRVLLAEDHTMVRQGLSRMLEAAGVDVVGEAADGLQVAQMVEETSPDVLLLDIGLPGLHGLDVIRQVLRRAPDTKVLVLSGDGREEFVLGSLRNGASGYLLKGGDSVELITAIAHIAAGGRYVTAAVSGHLVKALLDRPEVDPYETLTPREREVFHLCAEGSSNRDVGARLCISPRTAETHRATAMRKLGLKSHTDMVRYALRRGLITPEG